MQCAITMNCSGIRRAHAMVSYFLPFRGRVSPVDMNNSSTSCHGDRARTLPIIQHMYYVLLINLYARFGIIVQETERRLI